MEMSVAFHKEIKPVNKEHQSILDLKVIFRKYIARVVFVCFEVPCCFEVHIPVICSLREEPLKITKEASRDKFQMRF